MKVNSLIEHNNKLESVEVELELWPGLPEIHFLGRADQHLKESARRIKSAIKAQGFEFPVAQQILVNLRPSYLKKSSRGVELAVAAAFLMETDQVPKLVLDQKTFFYGELGLSGEVFAPLEGVRLDCLEGAALVTGRIADPIRIPIQQVDNLKALRNPVLIPGRAPELEWRPPDSILDFEISESWGRFLSIMALGQHRVLFAGAAGAGKTTAAKILHALMPNPTDEEKQELLARRDLGFQDLGGRDWRPFVAPHSQTPMASLIGGGAQIHGGELARADLGLLLLDEFFEFSRPVMEALRVPLEQSRREVSRCGRLESFAFRSQVVATTNLCPCGENSGEKGRSVRCGQSLTRCRSYSTRFTGPLLDRFEVLSFVGASARRSGALVRVRDLRTRLEEIRDDFQMRGLRLGLGPQVGSARLAEGFFGKKDLELLKVSERRKAAAALVAQSIAKWEGKEQLSGMHLKEAIEWSVTRFDRLKRWDF